MSAIAFSGFKGARALLRAAETGSKSSTSITASEAAKAATKQPKKKASTAPSKSTASVAGKEVKPRSSSNALFKLYPVSPALGSFLGVSEVNRAQAVKEVWAYAKRHNLQNHENKREIFCDETLKTLFGGKEKVGFSDVAKMISQHIVKNA